MLSTRKVLHLAIWSLEFSRVYFGSKFSLYPFLEAPNTQSFLIFYFILSEVRCRYSQATLWCQSYIKISFIFSFYQSIFYFCLVSGVLTWIKRLIEQRGIFQVCFITMKMTMICHFNFFHFQPKNSGVRVTNSNLFHLYFMLFFTLSQPFYLAVLKNGVG